MRVAARFVCPSSGLGLSALLRKSTGVLWVCLGLGVGIHLSFTAIRGHEAEQKTAKPLTTQFVKRQPRLTKPLELKKRPQPRRRQVQREMVAVKAKVDRQTSWTPFQPTQVLGGLTRATVDIGRTADFGALAVEPAAGAEIIEGAKEVEQRIDLSLELLDLEAMDTGQYDALVIQDPNDRQNVRGFCHLSVLYIPRVHDKPMGLYTDWFEWYVVRSVKHLAQAMNRYTPIEADVLGKVLLGEEGLFKTPWIFTWAFSMGYELSEGEMHILGQYLMQGGFLFADGLPKSSTWGGGAVSHERALLGAVSALGIAACFEELPRHHPIFHCYFDLEGPPRGYPFLEGGKLEGLEVTGRLVAILSSMGYYSPWADWGPDTRSSSWFQHADPTRQYQFGVNLIVFALTQEGSITHRLMESVR